MTDAEIVEIVEEDESRVDPRALADAKLKLQDRCKAASLELIEREYLDGESYLVVGLPNGRDKHWIPLFRLEQINSLLEIPFERYTFLGSYMAICSYEQGAIEALVRGVGPMGTSFIRNQLFGRATTDVEESDEAETQQIELISEHHDPQVKLKLGSISSTMQALARGPHRHGLSIVIEGLRVSQHDHALNILEKLSTSLFFQIDVKIGASFNLVKERRPSRARRRPHRDGTPLALQFPRTEYDEAPISLYWYARSALGMPLLQFLAYYQVVEFYFYSYSQEEARRKIQTILKDPTFRLDRDADIGRVLSALTTRGRGFGDERSQLRATIQACVDPNELRSFLTEHEERVEFFSNKQAGLTNHKLSIANKDADLRNDVADLIYDIRCKIVHTKGDSHEGEVELLLPFSKEADLLVYDIELLHYIAKQVLIAASSPIRF